VITDITVAGVSDFLKGSGRPELSSVTFFERDFGGDLSYPACIVTEAGDPEENEVIRGQYTVPISVVVMTIPEADESATTHRQITQAVTDLVGDAAALKGFLGTVMQVNDSTGGQGVTEPVDGYRQTTFALEIKCAEISDPDMVPYLINPKDLNPYLLYYGTQGITTEGGDVEKWTQAPGKSNQLTRDLVQTDASEQPTHDASGGFLQFDAVDKQLDFSATAVAQAGILVTATSNGIFAYEVDADSVDIITALGNETGYFQGLGLYAYALFPSSVSNTEVGSVIRWLEENTGATRNPTGSLYQYWADRTDLVAPKFAALDFSGVTNFSTCWYNCYSLEDFPKIDASSGTNFTSCWRNCISLTEFPALDLSSSTSFSSCWRSCSSLESFPALVLSSGTDFYACWYLCASLAEFPGTLDLSSGTNFSYSWGGTPLTEFPGTLDLSSGTDFSGSWYACTSLESFPGTLDLSSGTTFYYCWYLCASLEDFPANLFDYWSPGTPSNDCFYKAWDGCSSLTATSVENILNSIATSGVDAPASGPDITIDYDTGTGTPDITSAVTTLKACSPAWTITLNGVLQ